MVEVLWCGREGPRGARIWLHRCFPRLDASCAGINLSAADINKTYLLNLKPAPGLFGRLQIEFSHFYFALSQFSVSSRIACVWCYAERQRKSKTLELLRPKLQNMTTPSQKQ